MLTRPRTATLIFLLTLATSLAIHGQQPCPTARIAVERLPDLNVPRIGHTVFCVGGEVVAAGGHTTGFVPTPTAEYYSDGAWHLIPMTYPHDQGTMAVTAAGDVLLTGGFEKELGIGQTFTLEHYSASTHAFSGYGCLDQKRCFANALPLDSGCVVISGNWYHDDCIELYDGSRQCQYVKPVAQHRSLPYIVRTAKDNAIVFSAQDIHAHDFDTIVVDRLRGEPFTVPLFDAWRPLVPFSSCQNACFVGDEANGDYRSLIPVASGDSVLAIALVQGEEFSLLPTTSPIPMHSQWGRINWYAPILADRRVGRAYIMGYGDDTPSGPGDHRFYVAAIGYQSEPSPVVLYYSEPVDSAGRYYPVLTSDGDLMVVGGILQHNNNYDAASSVYLLHIDTEAEPQESRQPVWLWIVLASLLLAAAVAIVLLRRRHMCVPVADAPVADVPQPEGDSIAAADKALLERVCQYMEEHKPYLDSKLKAQDVADALGSNRTYVSNCIRNIRGCSFSQFVVVYRVEYSQQLLRQHPDMKLSEVWTSSGFSSESSFFRAFKAVTGVTPKDWKIDC